MDGVLDVRVGKVRSRDVERFEEVVVELKLKGGVDLKVVKGAVYGLLEGWEMPRKWVLF